MGGRCSTMDTFYEYLSNVRRDSRNQAKVYMVHSVLVGAEEASPLLSSDPDTLPSLQDVASPLRQQHSA